jgi:hypothetical protein
MLKSTLKNDNMAIERLACDADLGAQVSNLGTKLAHRSLRKP